MTTIQTSSGAFSSIADSGFISSGGVLEMTDEVLEVTVSELKSTPFSEISWATIRQRLL